MSEPQPFNPVLVAPNGRPARPEAPTVCPRCGRGEDVRVKSSGFGAPHDVCPCGFEFTEAP